MRWQSRIRKAFGGELALCNTTGRGGRELCHSLTFSYELNLLPACVTQPKQTGAWVPGWSLTLGRAWLRQKCRPGTPRDHRPARLQENDCQFGRVSADCMPRREGTAVIKQFSGERYCFKLPKRPVYFMSTLLTHTSPQTCATHSPHSHTSSQPRAFPLPHVPSHVSAWM